MHRTVGFVVATILGVGACSGNESADSDPGATMSASSSTRPALPTTTAVTSTGTITIGDDVYELAITCIAPGAGEVLAVGVGESADGERVEAYVQAFLGEPYVGVTVGSTLLESNFDGSLDLYLQDDWIRASSIRFVTDLDLETGDGEFVGLGSIEIRCEAYDEDLPPTAFG